VAPVRDVAGVDRVAVQFLRVLLGLQVIAQVVLELLVHVRERPVADVVQQSGQLDAQHILGGDVELRLLRFQVGNEAAGQVRHAHRVLEPRGVAVHVHKVGRPQLLDPLEALEFRRVHDQARYRTQRYGGVDLVVGPARRGDEAAERSRRRRSNDRLLPRRRRDRQRFCQQPRLFGPEKAAIILRLLITGPPSSFFVTVAVAAAAAAATLKRLLRRRLRDEGGRATLVRPCRIFPVGSRSRSRRRGKEQRRWRGHRRRGCSRRSGCSVREGFLLVLSFSMAIGVVTVGGWSTSI
jgi:hypothetical protein